MLEGGAKSASYAICPELYLQSRASRVKTTVVFFVQKIPPFSVTPIPRLLNLRKRWVAYFKGCTKPARGENVL